MLTEIILNKFIYLDANRAETFILIWLGVVHNYESFDVVPFKLNIKKKWLS
jgi:hypothetical protein